VVPQSDLTGKRLVVGLTGGIGSGKSAAAAEFARLGAAVVDTDAIAHELTAAGGAALPEIERVFGRGYLAESGEMDRKKMRERVFADAAARRTLEGLLHPMIRRESERRIAAVPGAYVVHVVPLLVESGEYRRRVDRVLVVDTTEDLQVERVKTRGLGEDEIRSIIRSQVPRAERLKAADDVLDNTGTPEALRQQVRTLHQKYLQLARP
jgi:dephospho-CoA kinase